MAEDVNKGMLIKADLCSRPNAMNGKYKAVQVELDDLSDIQDSDIFFLETLQMKADLADKMIADAEVKGKDTSDPIVMKELGEEINILGKPIHRGESIMSAIFVSLQLMVYYGIAIGIWGLVFDKNFLVFGVYGFIAGFIISLLFAVPVVISQRVKERIKEMAFAIGATWGNIGIIIGVLGLVGWIIRLIFFR